MGSSQDVADNVARLVMKWLEEKYLLSRHLEDEVRRDIKDDLAKVIHHEIKDYI